MCDFVAVEIVPLKMHCQIMVRKTKPRRVVKEWLAYGLHGEAEL